MLGLRRSELFALRWRHFDEERQRLIVREAVHDGTFSTPKTGCRSPTDSVVGLQ
jgi:integrase